MRIPVILSIVLCWVFGLLNESGWGLLVKTDEKMYWLIFFWSLYLFIIKGRRALPSLSIEYVIGFVLCFIIIPFLVSGRWDGALYMSSFLTIYCFSNINISTKELAITAFIIGILGLCLITVYLRTEILSGWNDNGIAMLTLFSFIYFATYFNSVKSKWKRIVCWFITILYVMQIARTDSRGALLFMSASIFFIFAKDFTKRYVSRHNVILFIIYFPLIIAIVTVWIAAQHWFTEFDTWYQLNYTKAFFNGREVLWTEAFKNLLEYPLGVGDFAINYHNSAVACIGVFGIVGYLLWSTFFIKLLKYLVKFFNDYMVYAFSCAFIIIYIQQSIELGFIKTTPNMLPYMVLGLGLGKIRWYKSKRYVYGKS